MQAKVFIKFCFVICVLCFSIYGTSSFARSDDQLKDESLANYINREFKNYPSADSEFITKAKNVNWRQIPKARKYKSRLIEAWNQANEPNFAGHYFVPKDIGCGTGCLVILAVDWKTGNVFDPSADDYFEVRKDSRLMILKPYDSCTAYGGSELYEFQKNRFVKKANKTACDQPISAEAQN